MKTTDLKMKALSILLCLCMVLQYVPTTAFAATGDNLCEHHTEHSQEVCGYVAAVAGSDCTHAHDGTCGYAEAVAEVLCPCEATDESGVLVHTEGCGYVTPVTGAECAHVHDDLCGYVQTMEAHPCHYECAECAAALTSEEAEETTAPSTEATEPSTEPAPVCNCVTDDEAVHATFCSLYVRPENPACCCAGKCEALNEWCDVCGFDYTQCSGTDEAASYAETITLYFNNTDRWSTVYVFCFGGSAEVTWPGTAMTEVESGIWSVAVPADEVNIIFNNGSGSQTSDLSLPTDGNNCYNYGSKTWTTYDAGDDNTEDDNTEGGTHDGANSVGEIPALGTVTLINKNYTLGTAYSFKAPVNIVVHTHDWAYTTDDAADTITAICHGTIGTCPVEGNSVTITLIAPEDSKYSGEINGSADVQGIIDGMDYTLRYTGTGYDSDAAPINAGTYTVTLTVGDKSVSDTFTISPKDISVVASCQFSLTDTTFTYSGKAPKLTVTAVDNGVGSTLLTENTDYTVGTVQVNAGSHKLTVTGKGNYTGTVELDYTITAKEVSITGAEIQPVTYDPDGYTLTVTGVTFSGVVEGETLAYTATAELKGTNAIGTQGTEVTVTLNNSNYVLEQATVLGRVTINKANQADLMITGKKDSPAYGDSFALGTSGGTTDGTVTWGATGTASVDESGKVTINGVGRFTITATMAGGDNYNDVTATWTGTSVKADPDIGNVTYDGETLYNSTAVSDVVLARTNMTVDGVLNLTDSQLTAGEGTYHWVFTPVDTENYNIITGTVTLNVTADVVEKIEASGTLEKDSYSYGDTFAIDGLTVTATYTTGATMDVTADVTFNRTLAAGQTSVVLTYQGKSCTVTGITVAKKQLVISGMSWNVPTDAVYSGSAYTATLTGELPEGVKVDVSGNIGTNAGNYTAKAVFSLADGFSAENYEIVNGADLTAAWSIAKAPLTVTAVSPNFIRYGDDAPAYTASYSGFVNGEDEKVLGGTLTFSCAYDTSNPDKRTPGDYAIVPSGLNSGNYEIEYVNGTLTVDKANIVIEIDDKTVTYGGAAPEYTYSYSGFKYGEDISVMDERGTVTCDYVPGTAVGTMEIKSTVLNYGSDDCYRVVNQRRATLTIEKAPLTVTAKDNTITYGDAPAASGVTCSGFVGNENADVLGGELTYTYSYAQFGNVGTYAITPAGLTSDNYEITFVAGELTVNPKAIAVTANAVSKAYGDADPALTYDVVGLINDDKLSGALSRATGENVGNYDIVQGTLTAGDNYTITYTGARLTINSKAITADDVKLNGSLTYNGKEQTQPITVTEGITYEVTGNKGTNVGTYELTVKGTGNYTGEVKLNWSIKEAAAVVSTAPTANTLTYNGKDQALVTEGTTADGTMVYSLTKDGDYSETIPTAKNAGEYTVWYYVVGDAYHADSEKASIIVNVGKADIADHAILFYAASSYDGTAKEVYVAGDENLTDTDLVEGVDYVLVYESPDSSDALVNGLPLYAGDYKVTLTGIGNYAGTVTEIYEGRGEGGNPYYTDVMTVRKAYIGYDEESLTAKDKVYDGNTDAMLDTVIFDGIISGDDASVEIKANFSDANAGTDKTVFVTFAIKGDDADNYVIEGSAELKADIAKKTVNVTANDAEKTYGDADPTFEYEADALVGNDQFTGRLDRAEGENIGSYAITIGTLTAGDNYKLVFEGAELVIGKRSVSFAANDQTIVYGEEIEKESFAVNGLLNGHSAVITLTPSTDKVTVNGTITASAAVITAGITDVTANYNVSYTFGKLVIEPDTSKIDALTAENVTSANEADIKAVQEMMENADSTKEEWTAISEKCLELLEIIEAVQNAADTENTEKVEDVTAENVGLEDKEALEDAKADLEKALEDNAGNYTEEEKKAIQDEIQRIDDAMVALENAQDVTDSITQLPETVEPDDEEAAEKILDAKESYDALTDHEKSLVDETTKKKLDDLVAALTDYDIIKGGGKWTQGSGSGLSFTANGPLSKFAGIEVDGREVDAKYYEAKSGGTIITLKQSFLKRLSIGEHTITVLYTDGETSGTFEILEQATTPATGDNSNIMLYGSMFTMSLAALAVLLLTDKKRRQANK